MLKQLAAQNPALGTVAAHSRRAGSNLAAMLDGVEGEDAWKTQKDRRKAAILLKRIEKKIEKYTKDIEKYSQQSNKAAENGNHRQAKENYELMIEAKWGKEEMEIAKYELLEIQNHKSLKFTFEYVTTSTGKTEMLQDGTISIKYGNTANAIHELHHAYQHISGAVQLTPGSGGGIYIDITDETSAYIRQYFFDPDSVKQILSTTVIKSAADITDEWVRGIYTNNINDPVYKNRDPRRSDVKGSKSFWNAIMDKWDL